MATVTTRVPAYVPTPEQIAQACDEIHERRLATFGTEEEAPPLSEYDRRERERLRVKAWRERKKLEKANARLRQSDETEPLDVPATTVCGKVPVPDGGPREMTKADICNVEFINARDLDDVFDGIIEAASFQHALEDCECRWNIADVDHDLMDLSDPAPFKSRDVVPFRSKRK